MNEKEAVTGLKRWDFQRHFHTSAGFHVLGTTDQATGINGCVRAITTFPTTPFQIWPELLCIRNQVVPICRTPQGLGGLRGDVGPIRNEAGHRGSDEVSKLEQNRGVIHT